MSKEKSRACPSCSAEMECHKVSAWNGDEISFTYFLSCSQCGRGPTDAFTSQADALDDWKANLLDLDELPGMA